MPERSCANRARSAGFQFALSLALGVTMATGGLAHAAASRTPSLHTSLIRTVEEFTSAQRSFDARKLARLTTPDYLEISPAGEVDSREKMLGFYAPDKKTAAPELAMSDVTVRMFGNAAVLIARISYKVRPPGQPVRTMEMRASFVAHRVSGEWKIASTQYTGIRPSAK
jgi:uncharacterized protein (TIGR02246 family)